MAAASNSVLAENKDREDYSNSERDVVVFDTNRGDVTVSRNQLARHSKMFELPKRTSTDVAAQSENSGASNLAKGKTNHIDLRQYDLSAVFLLVDFVNEKDVDDKSMSHHAIADLLQLTEVLEMPALRARLEKLLSVTVDSSADHIVTALLSVGVHPAVWRSPLGRSLFDVALRNYHDLPKASGFHKIPVRILIEILDSCDLLATSENDVFELARKWLKYNHNRVLYAPNLLECVRFYRLNDQQRAYIFQSIRKLPQGIQLEMIAKTVVGNLNGFRACVLKAHWQNPRCGSLPKEIRDRPLNVIPNFIDLAQLRKVALAPTGIKRQLSGTDDKDNSLVVIRNVHKPRSMRQQRRRARHQRNKEDLKVIESILGPGTTMVGSQECQLVEKILGPAKLKSLQTATACSSPVLGVDRSAMAAAAVARAGGKKPVAKQANVKDAVKTPPSASPSSSSENSKPNSGDSSVKKVASSRSPLTQAPIPPSTTLATAMSAPPPAGNHPK